jgi:hypothetical protein
MKSVKVSLRLTWKVEQTDTKEFKMPWKVQESWY